MLVSFTTARNATIYGNVVETYTDDEDGERHVQEARMHQFQPGERVSFRWARMTIRGTVVEEVAGEVLVRANGGRDWRVKRDRLVRLRDAVPSTESCVS